MLFKKCLNKERSKGFLCVKIERNSIGNENALNSEDSLIICSNSVSYCKVDQKKTVAISQMFNHVQLHIHWMHLLNTRICR